MREELAATIALIGGSFPVEVEAYGLKQPLLGRGGINPTAYAPVPQQMQRLNVACKILGMIAITARMIPRLIMVGGSSQGGGVNYRVPPSSSPEHETTYSSRAWCDAF